MSPVEHLLKRLDEIGQALADSGHGLALLGVGSVGRERHRLDEYSDLDFFAIVEPGYKGQFIADLSWLSRWCPIAYAFMNTEDGYKLLYEDGIFCEFAVFEPHELAQIPFAEGQIIWHAPHFDTTLAKPAIPPQLPARTVEWCVGEILTNLYVGLLRLHRGEILSAQRYIQHYAVDRILELAAHLETEQPIAKDPFTLERRFERRFPGLAEHLPQFIQGYERNRESARSILAFMEAHFEVNSAIKTAILKWC